jgi:hypothetical protein
LLEYSVRVEVRRTPKDSAPAGRQKGRGPIHEIYLVWTQVKIYLVLAPTWLRGERKKMLTTIKRLHRALVDRLADTRWLRDRAGANARWMHYERHAGAWRRASDRHAATGARASARADRWQARTRERHAASRQRAHDRLARITARAQRLAEHGPFSGSRSNQAGPTQKGEDAK